MNMMAVSRDVLIVPLFCLNILCIVMCSAMFAFVGYIVHANGITWPWPMTLDGQPFPTGLSPPDAWDAIPDAAKIQIFLFVGFLEFVSVSCIVILVYRMRIPCFVLRTYF